MRDTENGVRGSRFLKALKQLYSRMAEQNNDYEKITVASIIILSTVNADCLLYTSTYVKAEDGKQTVSAYVAQVAKENNAKVAVKKFVRFETGEGMQKKEEDFAAEVAKQMGN